MAGSQATEPGFNGQLASLAGLRGAPGTGRKYRQDFLTVTLGFNREAIPSNLARCWMMIQNSNTSPNWVGVSFGDATPAAANFRLEPGDAIVIDNSMPWSGSFGFYNTGAECYVLVQEFSLAQVN